MTDRVRIPYKAKSIPSRETNYFVIRQESLAYAELLKTCGYAHMKDRKVFTSDNNINMSWQGLGVVA
jgi:hypothetical protein